MTANNLQRPRQIHDARKQRDLPATKSIRISSAVPVLVRAMDGLCDRLGRPIRCAIDAPLSQRILTRSQDAVCRLTATLQSLSSARSLEAVASRRGLQPSQTGTVSTHIPCEWNQPIDSAKAGSGCQCLTGRARGASPLT
jgi:hypothetical protein